MCALLLPKSCEMFFLLLNVLTMLYLSAYQLLGTSLLCGDTDSWGGQGALLSFLVINLQFICSLYIQNIIFICLLLIVIHGDTPFVCGPVVMNSFNVIQEEPHLNVNTWIGYRANKDHGKEA